MLKIGLTDKAKIELDPAIGYPKVIAIHRILQGEYIETVCSHDLTMAESATIFNMSKSFVNSLKANPIKLNHANSEMDLLYTKLKNDLLESNKTITQEDLDNIPERPEFLAKFNEIRWMDFLTGNIPSYTVSDYPNADVIWNDSLNIWQVVATTEILPDQSITLPKPKE
jgi:predicted DNA-binding protein YlxM (UPF0122 family)